MDFKRKNGSGGGSGQTIQVATLPTASASELGKIYQYVGDTTSDYTNGYFYKCVESSGSYAWQETDVDSSVPFSGITGSPTDNAALNTALAGKQDAISDLTEIRSGAALGATALQSHQDISGKADTSALNSHTGNTGIHVTALEKAGWNAKISEPPTEGTSGQVLSINAQGEKEWRSARELPNGGSAGQVLVKNSSVEGDAAWIYKGEIVTVTLSYESDTIVIPQPLPATYHPYVSIINPDTEAVIEQKQYNGVALRFEVPIGTRYKVKYGEVTGYFTPATSIEYTATLLNANNINAVYAERLLQPLGLSIMRDDGNFYTSQNWNTSWNNRAVGVAIADAQHNILVAPNGVTNWYRKMNDINTTQVTDPDTGEEYANKFSTNPANDWAGEKNTECMIYSYDNDFYEDPSVSPVFAAASAKKHQWLDGVSGHLPSAGEANLAFINKSALNTLLSLIGGETIFGGRTWTSSYYGQMGSNYRVYMYYNSGGILFYAEDLNASLHVRSFRTLPTLTI